MSIADITFLQNLYNRIVGFDDDIVAGSIGWIMFNTARKILRSQSLGVVQRPASDECQ